VVGEAGDAEQALVRVRTMRPDVVLLDLLLPGANGYETIPRVVRAAPHSKVLVCTAMTGDSSVRRALLAGADGYVAKRASYTDLLEAVRRVASGERYVDPALGAKLVAPEQTARSEPLSDRERDVLHLLALGYTNQEIAKMLFVSVRTVNSHRAHIMRKLQLTTRADLVMFALAHGLIGPN
jgi:DNA-binding NarL/FixJ family response regulator